MAADGVVLLVAGAYVGSWDAFCILAALPATAEEDDRNRVPGIEARAACLSTGYAAGGGRIKGYSVFAILSGRVPF